jgi:hypothetical protein
LAHYEYDRDITFSAALHIAATVSGNNKNTSYNLKFTAMIKLKTYFISFFLFINVFLFGQTHPENKEFNKWTLGTILVSENNWRPTLQTNFIPNFFPGIIAKYNLEKFSLRVGIEHTQTIYDSNQGNCYFYFDGYKRETLLRVGIEKGIIIKRFFKPLFALDVFISNSYSDGNFLDWYSGSNYKTYINSFNVGVRPTIGIEFILSESLSISLESNCDFQWSKRNIDRVNLTLDDGFENIEDNIFSNSFNSIGAFSLNYHF